jgi:hypothetical protein
VVTGVSLGFVVPVAFWAVATLLALRPVRRPRLLARLSFRAGVVLDEVPQLLLYLLAASTVLTVADDVADPVTWAAVGVAVLTMAGLAALFPRGSGRRAVERALDVAGITARVDHRGWPWMRMLLVPFLRWRATSSAARTSGAATPAAATGSPPTATAPPERRARPRASSRRRLPQRGEHLIDAKKVLAWVHRHGRAYGADPSVLFMSGNSAGAHLTALCALTQNEPVSSPAWRSRSVRGVGQSEPARGRTRWHPSCRPRPKPSRLTVFAGTMSG